MARLGVIVKCQDYSHADRPAWLSKWVWDELPVEPYDLRYLRRRHKIIDPKWRRQRSVWRNHATFWTFRQDGSEHRARRVTGVGAA